MSVYFAHKAGLIKIGYSADPERRARDLGAELLGFIPGGRRMERAVHGLFARYHSHGEWFHPGNGLIIFVESLNGDGLDTHLNHIPDAYRRSELTAMCDSHNAGRARLVVFS